MDPLTHTTAHSRPDKRTAGRAFDAPDDLKFLIVNSTSADNVRMS
jgi:hypothetical protein